MEQFERANRYLDRVRQIYEGVFAQSHQEENHEDDLHSFFMHCYHIRDWVIQLNKIGASATEVDAFINSHYSLKVCADFANGSKHCRLTRNTRSGRQPHVVTKTYDTSTWLTSGGGGEVLKGKYQILSSQGVYDALALAEECMSLWGNYIENMQAVYNNSMQPTPATLRSAGPAD